MPFTERELIDWLTARAPRGPEVALGIGHDAAVVRAPSGDLLVLKSDQTIESVHFVRGEQPWGLVGRKALARVLSDVGAVGGRPVAALCSLALPADVALADVRALLDGLLEIATANGVSLVGGDLSRSERGVVIDIAGLGFLEGRGALRRDGARVGDAIVVTGPLGGSRAGHHLTFEPRWRAGVALAESGAVTSCIDLSDGLARDLHQITAASQVGAQIDAAAVPLRPLADGGVATIEQALHDGEDFELMFTVAPTELARLKAAPALRSLDVAAIGTVLPASEGVVMLRPDGTRVPLARGGYEHSLGI